ncbi:MAG: heme-binding protein, partial [Planctomycetota bacterium]
MKDKMTPRHRLRWLPLLVIGIAAAIAACSPEGRLINRMTVAQSGEALTQADVDRILVQAVSEAQSVQTPCVAAVVDRQGEVLGVFVMQGRDVNNDGTVDSISEADIQTAISKAATAAAFQSEQEAFTTRTAFFIVQGHYPPNVLNTAAGPLFGVQDSGMPSSDVHIVAFDQNGNGCGTGISGVLGGVPLYKNQTPVGGIGISTVAVVQTRASATDPALSPTLISPVQNELDEAVARAASRDFEAPFVIEATNLFVDGIQFPFFGTTKPFAPGDIASSTTSIDASVGAVDVRFPVRPSPFAEVRVGGQYGLATARVDVAGVDALNSSTIIAAGTPAERYLGRVVARSSATFNGTFTNVDRPLQVMFDPVFYRFRNVPVRTMTQANLGGGQGEIRTPFIDGVEPPPAEGGLTSAEVQSIIDAAAGNARLSVAGIRLPRGVNVVVHIAVCDARGNNLGVYRMGDGTQFSHDIAIQKARTAAFFSSDG